MGISRPLHSSGKNNRYSGALLLRDGLGARVDVSELTWEQREQVLRLLFARMNQAPHPRLAPPTTPLPPLPALEEATPTTLEQG